MKRNKTREERRRARSIRRDMVLISAALVIMVGAAFVAEWVAPSLI